MVLGAINFAEPTKANAPICIHGSFINLTPEGTVRWRTNENFMKNIVMLDDPIGALFYKHLGE